MRTSKRTLLSTRPGRAWALVLAASCALALLSQQASATAASATSAAASTPAASVSGKVGAYRFSTAAQSGSAGSCGYSDGRLATIAVTPPHAKMRAYWAEPHNGRLAVGQYVDFVARLRGLRRGTWTTLSSAHEYVLVRKSLTAFPALPAFTASRGIKRGYQAYGVVESLQWLRPTDNAPEGSVTKTLTHYRAAKRWDGACPIPPSSVAGIKAGPTASTIKLAWTNRTASLVKSIVVRYARGKTPPARPTEGRAITLTQRAATRFVVRHLRPKTRYAFSIWACGNVGLCSSRRATVVATRAPRVLTLGTPTIAASASGTSVSWTTSVDPHGTPATVQVTTDHGFAQTYTTGTTPWTSPVASQNIGYSATDVIHVTVSAAGRATTSASGSATTGGAPAVSVSRGSACAGHCAWCILSSCAYIHVTTANFAGSVTCTFSSQLGSAGFVSESYGANDSKDSGNYYAVAGTWVQATCGGVTARTTW